MLISSKKIARRPKNDKFPKKVNNLPEIKNQTIVKNINFSEKNNQTSEKRPELSK